MNRIHAHHMNCMLRSQIYSQSHSVYRHLPVLSSVKSNFLRSPYGVQPPSRNFSWEGFYYSVSTSTPVLTMQSILLDFHSFSGLPWWAVITAATFGIRSILVFPLTVHQNQVISRLANINVELGKMAPELNKEVNVAAKMYGWDETTAKRVFKQNMREYYQKFILRDNCHPFKSILLVLIQVPVWMFFSVALRNLTINPWATNTDSELLQQQFRSEGILWFTDLTVPDIYFIPILLALVNLTLIEIHALRVMGKSSIMQKVLLYGTRFITILIAAAATVNPSSVSFYWLCSSTFGLIQSITLMSPRCRRILRIPVTKNESSTPFSDIAKNFRKRFLS